MKTECRVSGTPVPQPRPRVRVMLLSTIDVVRKLLNGGGSYRDLLSKFTGQAYVPKTHAVHAWRDAVRSAYEDAGGHCWEGPLSVSLDILTVRPSRLVWKTKPMPRLWDTRSRGDVDNLAKAILDGLTGVAWSDDSQVVRLVVTKQMSAGGEMPGVVIGIEEAGHRTAAANEGN